MTDLSYTDSYRDLDIDAHPERYVIGKGQQGVLIVPWAVEKVIKPHWRFKTPAIAKVSAEAIYAMFEKALRDNHFPKADLCKKALHMGYTRARRYANHATGQKYGPDGKVLPQETDWNTSEKAESARVFYEYWYKARTNDKYLTLKEEHVRLRSQ